MSRRDILRRSAVGAATVGAVGTGAVRLDHGPVQNSQAIAPVVAAGAIAGSAATGWVLRETEIIGSDDPPEGVTREALENDILTTLQTRKDTNGETITDNKNIIQGLRHTAYSDGKIAAIEAIDDQLSQQEVEDSALDAVNESISVAEHNFLQTWNQTVEEVRSRSKALEDHPDADKETLRMADEDFDDTELRELREESYDITLANGEEKELLGYFWDNSNGPTDINPTSSDALGYVYWDSDYAELDADFRYMDMESGEWPEVWEELQDLKNEMRDEITTWVDGTYSEVQEGEINPDELFSPTELSRIASEDESTPQAIADLQALNIGTDLDREAEIFLPEIEATIYGQLSFSGEDDISSGLIDPEEKDGSIYITYDVSQGQGQWSAYDDDSGIDGGVLTLTAEPFVETIFVISTSAGETVELTADDFEEQDDDEWTADLSDDLDDSVTNVESIDFFSEVEDTQFETIRLRDEFELVRFTDSDGNEFDDTEFTRSEPHTNENYITSDEWEEQAERYDELIEKYEDSQGGGISIPGVEDVLDGEANGLIGIAVVGMVLVSAILSALNPLS